MTDPSEADTDDAMPIEVDERSLPELMDMLRRKSYRAADAARRFHDGCNVADAWALHGPYLAKQCEIMAEAMQACKVLWQVIRVLRKIHE